MRTSNKTRKCRKCRKCRTLSQWPLLAASDTHLVCACGMCITSKRSANIMKPHRGRVRIVRNDHSAVWVSIPAMRASVGSCDDAAIAKTPTNSTNNPTSYPTSDPTSDPTNDPTSDLTSNYYTGDRSCMSSSKDVVVQVSTHRPSRPSFFGLIVLVAYVAMVLVLYTHSPHARGVRFHTYSAYTNRGMTDPTRVM